MVTHQHVDVVGHDGGSQRADLAPPARFGDCCQDIRCAIQIHTAYPPPCVPGDVRVQIVGPVIGRS